MSLFAALNTAGEALANYQRGIAVIQNNVVNYATPGFAKQRQSFIPKDFSPESGLMGGARLGDRESFRRELIEQGVRRQNTLLGRFDQLALSLSQVESLFDISGETGVPAALNNFFNSLSALSVTPNDATARQNVIGRAGELARAFQGTSNSLGAVEADSRQQVSATVGRINELTVQVRDFNSRVRQNAGTAADAGLDARLHSTLEELSNLAGIQVLGQDDGTVTVLLGGQAPLVIGEHQFDLETDLSQAGPVLRDVNGNDVGSLATGGRLGAVLHVVNTVLPGLRADLNLLAQSISDNVNVTLAAGIDQSNLPGQPLFTYNLTTDAAATFAVTGLTGAQIAAAESTAPGGNGNALNLAALGRTPQVGGETFASFFGGIAASAGRELALARDGQSAHSQLIAQARAVREQQQGVSLDEEATHLVELQRSYQAAARMVTVLDELTRTTIDMLR